ncbi:hypothetical protein ANTRET_LOCUS9623 [Anthophora retusa]
MSGALIETRAGVNRDSQRYAHACNSGHWIHISLYSSEPGARVVSDETSHPRNNDTTGIVNALIPRRHRSDVTRPQDAKKKSDCALPRKRH